MFGEMRNKMRGMAGGMMRRKPKLGYGMMGGGGGGELKSMMRSKLRSQQPPVAAPAAGMANMAPSQNFGYGGKVRNTSVYRGMKKADPKSGVRRGEMRSSDPLSAVRKKEKGYAYGGMVDPKSAVRRSERALSARSADPFSAVRKNELRALMRMNPKTLSKIIGQLEKNAAKKTAKGYAKGGRVMKGC